MPPNRSTISIDPESNLVFGGSLTVSYTSNSTAQLWGHMEVSQGGQVVCAQFATLSDPLTQPQPFGLGPTPMWQGGAATGKVDLVTFDTKRGTFSKPLATTTFSVAA